jgi:hypothetical protein
MISKVKLRVDKKKITTMKRMKENQNQNQKKKKKRKKRK